MQRRQGLIWMLTIPAASWSPQLHEGVAYCRGQQELGEGGFLHWQLVVHFERKQSLTGVKRVFPREAHCELTRSSAAESYVWKDLTYVEGTRFELGEKPFRRNNKTDWDIVWQSARDGDFMAIPASVRVQCYSNLRRIRSDFAVPVAMVIYIN